MYNPEDLQNSLTNDKDLGINVVSVDKTFASIFSNYTQVLFNSLFSPLQFWVLTI